MPALGFIVAGVILAAILGALTWRNLNREERMMESFLREEGLILTRAFEAGARTSLMMEPHMAPLSALVRETTQAERIAYVIIADTTGSIHIAAGNLPSEMDTLPVGRALSGEAPVTRLTRDEPGHAVFEVSREFSPIVAETDETVMTERWRQWCDSGRAENETDCRQAIFVGLYTREFEAARREDVKQSLVLGGALLLLGAGGFYFLFLSQETRVVRRTLENMELYTRDVIESMPAGLITLDEQGRIVSLNERARTFFGKQGESVEGKPMEALAEAERCEIAPLIRQGREFVDRPMDCRGPSGESIPVKVSASRLRDREGAPLGMVLIVRDMREIRAMEEALERSRRLAAMGRMAAGIAHEIRNPLSTLRGFAQYFSRRNSEDEKAREYADLMVGEVDRLNRAISALLQFARPREPEFSPVNLGELLERTRRLQEGDMTARRIALRLDPPAEAVVFQADPDLLIQVLINLLQNAMAASESGGEVSLGGSADGQSVRLFVQDSGKGMHSEERERMFDPFFTTRKEGIGLGLAVVQQVVEQHGGRIVVTSTPAVGTGIEVILPRERTNGNA